MKEKEIERILTHYVIIACGKSPDLQNIILSIPFLKIRRKYINTN